MRIVVLGAGALGSLVGGLLVADNDVTIIGREPHMSAIASGGLKIDGLTDLIAHPKTRTDTKRCSQPDVLILTVKSYDTEGAMVGSENIVGEDTLVISLQNGLGNIEKIAGFLDKKKIIGGVTSHGATLIGNGHVRHAGYGDTVIGKPYCENDEAIERIAHLLTSAGLETRVSGNILGEIWAKVLVNAAINPIATILRKRNGHLLEHERSREIMRTVISEGVSVAGAQGIGLSESEVMDMALEVARLTADNKCSMLQDVERGCRTEIDYINGAIVRLGEAAGISTPVNSDLTSQIKKLSSQAQKI